MGTPAIGALTTFVVDDSVTSTLGDFDAGSFRYEFVPPLNLGMTQTHADGPGIRGTRSHAKETVRITQERIGGSITLRPTPVELDQWLPRILGAAESSDSFALGESIPAWSALVDRVTNRFIYAGCYVNKATFSGSQGQPITLALDIEGLSETISASAVPGGVPAINSGAPYVFSDCTYALTADASATLVREFEITIDNVLTADRYFNSVTRAPLFATDRMITVKLVVPYTSDEVDLYDQAVAGAAGTLTLTNGGQSTLFTFANLKCPAETPPIQDKGEMLLTLNMVAYQSGSTKELVVTHDSTA